MSSLLIDISPLIHSVFMRFENPHDKHFQAVWSNIQTLWHRASATQI